MKTLPKNLYVEITTRCNLRCDMCVKQSPESHIPDESMSMETFERLIPAFKSCDTLVLNGIGEPALHPNLVDMVSLARRHMPAQGLIGFQTNGVALTERLMRDLLEAGLNRICFSVDSLASYDDHGTAQATIVFERIRFLRELVRCRRPITGRPPSRTPEPVYQQTHPLLIGCEIVIHSDNVHELPRLIDWVGSAGTDFCIVSHLFPYSRRDAEKALFQYDTEEARNYLHQQAAEIMANNFDLHEYSHVRMKYNRTEQQDGLLAYVSKMLSEAMSKGHPLHMGRLLLTPKMDLSQLESIFSETQNRAATFNIELHLPRNISTVDRKCPFMESDWGFVGATGSLHPCHFLWHQFGCWPDAEHKTVWPVCFGNITGDDFEGIWMGTQWVAFRETARLYDAADCFSCHGVCSDVRGDFGPFTTDCYGVDVPCGHCPWCLGGFQCMR